MNGKPDLFLTIDQGTQSVRAMVFDADGQMLAKSQLSIQPYYSLQPGWAEQDCSYYWAQLSLACQHLWRDHPELQSRIAGVGVTALRSVTVCLDEQLNPLRPAIGWLDQRRTKDYPRLPLGVEAAVRLLGLKQSIHYFQSKAECNWLAADYPEVWAKTRHFVFLSAYLNYRLTGTLCDAVSSQVGYVPFDYKRQRWAGPRDLKWQLFAVRRSMLPALIPAGQRMGHVQAQAAQDTGIALGLPVFACGADKACEVLASGAWTPELASLSYGTTATINTCNERYVEPIFMVPAYPAAAPARYNSEIMVQRGFWMVNWFKEQFASQDVQAALALGVAPEALFEQMLTDTPAGNMGLLLQPFWNPGVRIPGPEAKGAMIGFGDVHNRSHMYRAIIEGIAFALREGARRLEKRNGVKIARLLVSGGGSQSDQIMQITANVFGLPAQRLQTFEASGLGAAMNVAVGLGRYADHASAQAHMSRAGACFEPQRESAQLYDQLYKHVYAKTYGRLAPLYRAIRHLTNYPRLD